MTQETKYTPAHSIVCLTVITEVKTQVTVSDLHESPVTEWCQYLMPNI